MLHPNSRASWLRITALVVGVAALAAIAVGTSSGRRTADKPTIAFVSQGTSNSWAAQLDAGRQGDRRQARRQPRLLQRPGRRDQAAARAPDRRSRRIPMRSCSCRSAQAADTGPVERAMAQGIAGDPLRQHDQLATTTPRSSIPNPATAAKPLAEWLAKQMHYKGNLLYIGGLPGNATTILYDKGFNTVMKKYPNIKVVNGGNANYSISTAKQLTATATRVGQEVRRNLGRRRRGRHRDPAGLRGREGPADPAERRRGGDERQPAPCDPEPRPGGDAAVPAGRLEGLHRDRLKAIKGQKVPKLINISCAPGVRQPLPAAQAVLQAAVQRRPLRRHRQRADQDRARRDPPDQVTRKATKERMEGFEGPLVAARGIHKHYGGINALDDVSLEVLPARSTPSSARTAPASRRSSRS